MKSLIVCIYDKVSNSYQLFSDFVNKAVILRHFTDLVNNPQFVPGKHPSDYDIVIVGELDVHTGVIIPMCDKVCCLNELVEVKKSVENIKKVGE